MHSNCTDYQLFSVCSQGAWSLSRVWFCKGRTGKRKGLQGREGEEKAICWLRSMITQVLFFGWHHADIFSTDLSSPLPVLFSPFLAACHQNHTEQYIFPQFPSPVSSWEWCQNKNVSLANLPSLPVRRLGRGPSLTSLCQVTAFTSRRLSSLALGAPSLSSSVSVFLPLHSSLSFSPLPLLPLHKSIGWSTGCVTDRLLWAAWNAFVDNIGALLNSVCGF